MTALNPAPNPFMAGLAEAEALHLRFAISPIGPSLSHLPGGMEAMSGPQGIAAWHELTLGALVAEETGWMAGPVSLTGRSPDEEWMTLPMMQSALDGAWILP